jgi:predicted nucleic acid-binding protein
MRSMSGKVFVDSNVLVYAYDRDAGIKQRQAEDILFGLRRGRLGALSMQVLQEFYTNVTRKIKMPLSKADARGIVNDFSHWCIETTPAEITRAFQIEDEARIGFWDALIVAAAIKSGATRIISEDLNTGQIIAGITIENPFANP